MAVMEISVVPVGTGNPSISEYVAGALEVLRREEGVTFDLTPMGTIVQAESVETLLGVAARLHRSVLEAGACRVLTSIKIDDRTDKELTMEGKVRSVKDKLAK